MSHDVPSCSGSGPGCRSFASAASIVCPLDRNVNGCYELDSANNSKPNSTGAATAEESACRVPAGLDPQRATRSGKREFDLPHRSRYSGYQTSKAPGSSQRKSEPSLILLSTSSPPISGRPGRGSEKFSSSLGVMSAFDRRGSSSTVSSDYRCFKGSPSPVPCGFDRFG